MFERQPKVHGRVRYKSSRQQFGDDEIDEIQNIKENAGEAPQEVRNRV
jgi:hypothetical protein